MAKGGLRDVSNGCTGKAYANGLTSNRITDILSEAFTPVESFQRILEGVDLSGGEHQVSSLDVATVLETLNAAARDRAQELLEDAVGAS